MRKGNQKNKVKNIIENKLDNQEMWKWLKKRKINKKVWRKNLDEETSCVKWRKPLSWSGGNFLNTWSGGNLLYEVQEMFWIHEQLFPAKDAVPWT